MRKQQIPWLMATGRALLGPVLVIGEKCGWNGLTLAALIVTALLSDIFDGILARHWKCDTAGVRLFDSMADTVFYGCVLLAMWTGMPTMWAAHEKGIVALLAMEAINHGLGLAKFRKPPSYHSYLAKTFGLVLAAATVTVFATERANTLLTIALALGVASNVEGVAMSLLLPVWRRDVKTLAAAWRLRRKLYSVSSAQSREVVSLKPATGASASMEPGLCSTSGAVLGR
jgi:CDP-diacylglycerol--glycerol-3-phosphate 3-phosphatidyltransferase